MTLQTARYDVADYLIDDRTILAYLGEALESGEPQVIGKALASVARARGGMAQLAADSGIEQNSLERVLLDKDPDLRIVLKVFHALGLKLIASRLQHPVAA